MTQNPEAITKGDPFKYIKTPHGKKKKKILPHAKCKSKRQSSSEECLPLSPQRIPLANTEKGRPTRQKRKMGTDMTREIKWLFNI